MVLPPPPKAAHEESHAPLHGCAKRNIRFGLGRAKQARRPRQFFTLQAAVCRFNRRAFQGKRPACGSTRGRHMKNPSPSRQKAAKTRYALPRQRPRHLSKVESRHVTGKRQTPRAPRTPRPPRKKLSLNGRKRISFALGPNLVFWCPWCPWCSAFSCY